MITRQCPFCGKTVSVHLRQCTQCRETLPRAPQARSSERPSNGGAQIRRGLLYMLLAAVIGYFAGGFSSFKLPIPVLPVVTKYLSPLLFLSGLGMAIYGYYLQHKPSHQDSA
jgi:hypothetical protein